jgi:hypothetical protein
VGGEGGDRKECFIITMDTVMYNFVGYTQKELSFFINYSDIEKNMGSSQEIRLMIMW